MTPTPTIILTPAERTYCAACGAPLRPGDSAIDAGGRTYCGGECAGESEQKRGNMLVSFELSMPRNNAWNNKWSGAGNTYAIIKSFGARDGYKPKFKLGIYSYDFGDGWVAQIATREVSISAANMLRKESKGFCGYDWMVDSIVRDGDIYGPNRPKPAAAPV